MSQQSSKMQPPADRPYKTHLDEAASHQTEDYREPSTIQKAVEKGERCRPAIDDARCTDEEQVTEYIPAAAGPLQQLTGHPIATKTEETEQAPAPEPSQLPERPVQDEHIENFVREQHRQDGSKILDGHKQ